MLMKRCAGYVGSSLLNVCRTARRGYFAAVVGELGKLEIREMKQKSPREHELLIEVESSGVNPADMRMINGTNYLKPNLPFVPGFELAGNVKSVGKKVRGWKEGDRVAIIKSCGTGAFAEECIADSNVDIIVPLAYSVSYETAATVSTSYGTAYLALQRMAKELEGLSLLVLSSRGMVAFAAIDLAHNVFKANVLAASDSEEKLEKLRETGVLRTINFTKENLVDVVKNCTNGHGVDFVVDTVGGKVFEDALNCLRPGGELCSLGFTSGEIPHISVLDLHRTQTCVSGIWLGGHQQQTVEKVLSMVFKLFEEQFLQARVDSKYSLKDAPKCVDDINNNLVFGKALINMKD